MTRGQDVAADAVPVVLPDWAIVVEKRRAHIQRVTNLLDQWARQLGLDAADAQAWHDAGRWHDALRDADEPTLRAATGDLHSPAGTLHGPAAAKRIAAEGESRTDVLEAIRWHTLGNPGWARTGRALYMADYLEPGRPFARAERAFLASHVIHDFDGVFREVVRHRLAWTVHEGNALFPETVALWNAL
jgi:HD superfamily phosphohydrolase YqeK